MSPHASTEDQRVEQPAVALFGELGWATVSASDEVFGLTRGAPCAGVEHRGARGGEEFARELLARLKLLLVLNWRRKSSARSQLKIAIEDVLDTGLPRAYGKPLYEQKCTAIFEHVYESYPERDTGVYSG